MNRKTGLFKAKVPVEEKSLSNRTYDILRFLVAILVPSLGTTYFAFAEIWDLPQALEVVGFIMVAETLLGALMLFSTRIYENSNERYDGTIDVREKPDGGILFELDLSSNPDALEYKDEILFRVNHIR